VRVENLYKNLQVLKKQAIRQGKLFCFYL